MAELTAVDFNAMMKAQEEKALDPNTYAEQPKFKTDERFYKISKDKEGNAKVKIRFMPSFNSDKTSLNMWKVLKVHNANWHREPLNDKSEKRYLYPEVLCPKTANADAYCPICDYGWEKYNEIPYEATPEGGTKSPKQVLKSMYRKEFTNNDKIITNIMVIKDDVNPENEGKIFLFEIKNSIFKMFATEAEKVQNELADCSTPEDRQARNIPADLRGFDAFNLMCSKDLWLIFKDKKNHPDKDPKHYWGGTYWDSIFTDKTNNNSELAMELVSKAYCLDDEAAEEKIPKQEFLEEKLAHLTFQDGKKKETTVSSAPASQPSIVEQMTQNSQAPVSAPVEAVKAAESVSAEELIANIQSESAPTTPAQNIVSEAPVAPPSEPVKNETSATPPAGDSNIDDVIAQIMAQNS